MAERRTWTLPRVGTMRSKMVIELSRPVANVAECWGSAEGTLGRWVNRLLRWAPRRRERAAERQ